MKKQLTISDAPMKGSIYFSGTPKEELERLQRQKVIVPLGIDETSNGEPA